MFLFPSLELCPRRNRLTDFNKHLYQNTHRSDYFGTVYFIRFTISFVKTVVVQSIFICNSGNTRYGIRLRLKSI